MRPSARERFILERLEASGACTYQSLAEALHVAEMTVRRDVEKMAKVGLCFKVLGGVQTAGAPRHFYESELEGRIKASAAEKRLIAREAARRIDAHQTIFLDGGTTSLALAKVLAEDRRPFSVVTFSTFVCYEVSRARHLSLLVLGGTFDPLSGCLVGPTSEELAGRYFVDVAFFSTMGVVPAEGTFESNIAALRVKQLIAAQARKNVLIVDHTKFGTRALCKVLDIAAIHEVITDSGVPSTVVREIEAHGPKVIVAAGPVRSEEAAVRAS